MMTTCPECGLPISDKALSCPHCGYPLSAQNKIRKSRRRRLPNGFGSIFKRNDRNLRKPYRARVTVGVRKNGKYKFKDIGAYETYNDAYAALVEYNKNPYEIEGNVILDELYERWSDEYFKHISKSAARTIRMAWSHSADLHDMAVKDIRARHIKAVIDKAPSSNIAERIKSMFNLLLDYALEYEIVQVNYARTFDLKDINVTETDDMHNAHMVYSEEEMQLLWQNINDSIVQDVLIQCYTGWRPQELCNLRTENINLNNWTMSGGMKTAAGTHRVVPIHSKIRPLVMAKYNPKSEWFITDENGKHMTYDKLRHRYEQMRERLGLNKNHRLHDGRKTFVTMAKNAGVDEYAIKKIVGHKISDITEAVYTTRPSGWLTEEMKKI